jgi:hypothetical protein
MPEHVEISCASEGCFAIITLHPEDQARLRRSHERFYCPAGHANLYPGRTLEQKEREELERRLMYAERHVGEWRHRWEEMMEAGTLLVAGVRTCPLGCGWTAARKPRGLWQGDQEAVSRYMDRAGRDLAEHLMTDHNATRKPIALLPERTVVYP